MTLPHHIIKDSTIRAFRRKVYRFYRSHGRSLPWRETSDPYHILVSELMLQQTQVERVVGKYHEFISAFPDIRTLARAPLKDILRGWEGLGYNRRALYLKKSAIKVIDDYGGEIPASPGELANLPGIGPATASSIAVFAFNQPLAFIETNIRTVFLHAFFPGVERVTDDALLPLVHRSLDRINPRHWYNALMDYGTMLKKKVGNPNRRSAHYTRQSPFKGSDRQVRGVILRLLTVDGRLEEPALIHRAGRSPGRVRTNLDRLKREGLIKENRGSYEIA